MEETILNLANQLYKEWLKTNDPFEEDFKNDVLDIIAPNVVWGIAENEIIIIKID